MGKAAVDDARPTEPTGRPYRITFKMGRTGEEREVLVHPDALPADGDGRPGSILQIALAAGVPIEHACGGVCACATCHVIVREGLPSCSAPGEQELDQLDRAPGLTAQSRLACQTVPSGQADLRVEIPAWNRNLATERP